MSKDKISDYSTTASNNTEIAGIGIQGTNAVSNFDGAFRTIMKQLADMNAGTSPIFDTFTLCDPADNTKKVRIDAGTVATATTRVLTMPNADVTISAFVATALDDVDAVTFRNTIGAHDASNISAGTLADARLPTSMAGKTFTSTSTFNGNIVIGSAQNIQSAVDNSVIVISGGTSGTGANIELYGSTHATNPNQALYDANTHAFRQANGAGTPTVTIGGNTVWHAGNDGAGSGLDADLLDGLNATSAATASTIMSRDGSGTTSVARIDTDQISYQGTAIIIGNAGSEDFRINTDAILSNGLTVTKTAIGDSGTGFSFQQAGIIWVSRENLACGFYNRDTSDGTLMQFGRSKTAVGSISVTTTATAYNTSSDGRLKTNRKALFGSGAVIDAIQPLTYDWVDVPGASGVGFIAQDLHLVIPEAVKVGDSDPEKHDRREEGFEMWEVDLSKIVPYLVAEVKSLRSRVATLESE